MRDCLQENIIPVLFRLLYMNALGIQQYTLDSLLFLRIVQEKIHFFI